MMGAVLVADDRHRRDLAVGGHAVVVVGLVEEGVHALAHALAMLDGWPSQIGVPITRMSAARMRARSLGQASPLPSLDFTPGLMLRSATRTIRPVQSWPAKASDTCFNRASVDDFSPARFRVQLSAMNFSGAGAMAGPSCPPRSRGPPRPHTLFPG